MKIHAMATCKSFICAALVLMLAPLVPTFGGEAIPSAMLKQAVDALAATSDLHEKIGGKIESGDSFFDLDVPDPELRMREFAGFADAIDRLESLPPPRTGSHDQRGRMVSPRRRLDGAPASDVPAARRFMTGPEQMVHPHSGEVVLERNDILLNGRAGIDFAFTRFYRSFLEYDGPLGSGWDHNHNLRLLVDANDPDRLVLLNGLDAISFRRDGEAWASEPGWFYQLDMDGDKRAPVISDANGISMIFEPLAETPDRGWRIRAIHSRHGRGAANRIVYQYAAARDLLVDITDVWGNIFVFAYNSSGRLECVSSRHFRVEFSYDDDRLVEAATPNVAMNATDSVDMIESYEYDRFQGRFRLSGLEEMNGFRRWRFDYAPATARVTRIAGLGGEAGPEWSFAADAGKVVVTPPAPMPVEEFEYGPTGHPSLPTRVSRPGDGAAWRYEYNDQLQLAAILYPEGHRDIFTYDTRNGDPRRRGDVLTEETTAARDGGATAAPGIVGKGVAYSYHPLLSLPAKCEKYETDANGDKRILDVETWEYEGEDLLLAAHVAFGVKTLHLQNFFGETVMRRIGDAGCAIYYYADGPADGTGSPRAGGRLVRSLRDAPDADIRRCLESLGSSRREAFLDGLGRRQPAAALETRFEWNGRGDLVATHTDSETLLTCGNRNGQPLAAYSSATGLELTRYNRLGLPVRILRPHVPAEGGYAGAGDDLFSGRFTVESFRYDALNRVESWEPTAEPMADGVPVYRYSRYPSGTVRETTAPSGATRIDVYDAASGKLKEVRLRSRDGDTISLRTDIAYFPSGRLRGYRDNAGQKWSLALDGLGRSAATIRPDGVTESTSLDGLDRVTLERIAAGETIYMERATEYGGNSLPTRITLDDRAGGRKTVEYEAVVNERGLVSAERTVRLDSWTWNIHDNLNRVIAACSPADEVVTILYAGEKAVMRGVHRPRARAGVPEHLHTVYRHDRSGRPIAAIPVSADDETVLERAVWTRYDELGRQIRMRAGEKVLLSTIYNSLGQTTEEVIQPLTTECDEQIHKTVSVYHADGRLASRTVENAPLVLADNAPPGRRPLPQRLSVEYDGFDRVVAERNPDGRVFERKYGTDSLVGEIAWWNATVADSARRSLSLRYDAMQRLAVIRDATGGNTLRELSYDTFGNCVEATEFAGGESVRVARRFDATGFLLEEKTTVAGISLPALTQSLDRPAGIHSTAWSGDFASGDWWKTETRRFDAGGRLVGVSLDGVSFSNWEYAGSLATARTIPGIGWRQEYSYDRMGDLRSGVLSFGEGWGGRAALEYRRDRDGSIVAAGQTFADGMEGRDKTEWRYYAHDAHGRAVAETKDLFAPGGVERRRAELLGHSDAAKMNLVHRTNFDQAGNVWLRYNGAPRKADSLLHPDGEAEVGDAHPVLSSPAFPVGNADNLDERERGDLSSNRLAATAAYASGEYAEQDERRYHFNEFGELAKWRGDYDDGEKTWTVEWSMHYSPLGSLLRMEAGDTENGETVASLDFLYDAFGRRVGKAVNTPDRRKSDHRFSYHSDDRLAMVYLTEGTRVIPREKYLWGGGERELLAMCRPQSDVEDNGVPTPRRYFYLQNHEFNVMALARVVAGELKWMSQSSYRLFGEDDTHVDAASVRVPGVVVDDTGAMIDNNVDKGDAEWRPLAGRENVICLRLPDTRALREMTVWAGVDFPGDFAVYVIPEEEEDPDDDIDAWARLLKPAYLAQKVMAQRYVSPEGYFLHKTDRLRDPYRIALAGMRGNRIVLAWTPRPDEKISVREFGIAAEPRKKGGFAFAGQWLDVETGLYYHGARYYHPAMNGKFISPDSLGFLAGNNLYAYGNNDPLAWHDPDGRIPAPLIGAGVGALLGGGSYLFNVWWTGAEFDWWELAIQTGSGALSGAAASVGFMGATAYLANMSVSAGVNGVATLAAAGFAGGFVGGASEELMHRNGLSDALVSGLTRGVVGAAGGGVGGGIVSRLGAGPLASIFAGAAGGGTTGALTGAYAGYQEAGLSGAAYGAARGGAVGALAGGVIGGAAWGVGRAGGVIRELEGYPETLPDPRQGLMVRTKRPDNVTYGGTTAKPGTARHHQKPLSLGGTDTPGNMIDVPMEIHRTPHPGQSVKNASMGTWFY